MDSKYMQAFSPGNPAITLLRIIQSNPDLRAAVSRKMGLGDSGEVDEDSFLREALRMERPRGTT